MVARYGDFVLYRPPVSYKTWLLWLGPFVLLLLAVIFFLHHVRQRQRWELDAVLSDEDTRRVRDLLREDAP
jgi:cytochrome c-type biogenesis protein CcmH